MSKSLKNESAYLIMPPVLKSSKNFDAAGMAIADQLMKNACLSEDAAVYDNIDKLPEEVLNIIAYDFSISWYDYGYSLEEKRSIIKEAFKIFRSIGTKYAVETALRSIYPDSHVREWYEYEGEPYHFKVEISDSANDREKSNRVLQKVRYCKNARSVMDETVYTAGSNIGTTVYCGAKVVGVTENISRKAEIYI